MNVLIVGGGKGSWTVRGEQLGVALGARVTSHPTADDWRWADRVVLVKNHGAVFAPEVHRRGVPLVWDALDFWRQPLENASDETRARTLLQHHVRVIKPALVIGATQAMATACDGVYVPHHSWVGLAPSPARTHVQVVAYEGNALYLGQWQSILTTLCHSRGWSFVINPPTLADVDIVVALRDGIWDGWICRQWKSGVKLVNAMAAGRPVITQESAAFRELAPVGCTIDSREELARALDRFADVRERATAVDHPGARSLTVDQVAARYRRVLQEVQPCAA